MTKPIRKVPKFFKEKTSDRVQPKTLMVAALTAITLAFISTRLDSLTNRLVLVAMLSLMTAVIGEFYRLILESIHSIVARSVAEQVEEEIDNFIEDSPTVEDEVVTAPEQANKDEIKTPQHSYLWLFFHRIFVSRWAVYIVFMTVALVATLGGSYILGINAKPNVEVVQHLTETKDLSSHKEKELSSEAKKTAAEEAHSAEKKSTDRIKVTKEELTARLEELSLRLDSEARDNEALLKEVVTLQKNLDSLQKKVDTLPPPVKLYPPPKNFVAPPTKDKNDKSPDQE